jgi:hypothetical protein
MMYRVGSEKGAGNLYLHEAFLQLKEPVLMSTVFCVVTLCSLPKVHRLFTGTKRVNLQG